VAVGGALCYAATARVGRIKTESVESAEEGEAAESAGSDEAVAVAPDPVEVERSPEEALDYWREKGADRRMWSRESQRSSGDGPFEALRAEQLREVAFMVECAVRGKVSARSLQSWLTRLGEGDDRPAAAEALRARLVEKANEVELPGRLTPPEATTECPVHAKGAR
jgi:hypothetical protein